MSESQAQNISELKHRRLPSDRKKSPCFHVPEYMHPPQVYVMYGHQIRIWRCDLEPLNGGDFRRISALMDWTDLETGLTLGLHWAYSTHQRPEWKHIKYQLYSHFPGSQPCKDLQDVYKSTTAEIKWVISTLKRQHDEKTRPRLMVEEAQGVFPQ